MSKIFDRIKRKISEKGWTQSKLCSEIEVTQNGFKRMVDNNSIKLSTLQKIADTLNTPISYFLDDSFSKQDPAPSSVLSALQSMVDELRKDKEQLIKDKEALQHDKETLQQDKVFYKTIIEKKMLIDDNSHLKVSGNDSLGKIKECPKATVMAKQLKFPEDLIVNSVQKVLKQG